MIGWKGDREKSGEMSEREKELGGVFVSPSLRSRLAFVHHHIRKEWLDVILCFFALALAHEPKSIDQAVVSPAPICSRLCHNNGGSQLLWRA